MTSLSQDSSVTRSEETIKKLTGSQCNGRPQETCHSGPATPPSQDCRSLIETFPWIPHFSQLCAQQIPNTTISRLEKLITHYIREVSSSVSECYSRPNRAAKLKRSMSDTLMLFHMMYTEIKKPLEHSSILAKMSHLIAMYLDMEIKASRRATESLPKIASKLTSALHLYLDQSQDHILDAILRAKNITKNFWELSDLIFRRVLRDSPGSWLYEMSYVRYILAFKTWKSLMKGAEERRRITQLAVLKVQPPAGFRERLASGGWLGEVLPRVPKTRTDITMFLMQAKFSVRDKTKVFLKALTEGSREGYLGMDQQLFYSEDPPAPSNSDLQEDSSEGSSLINDIWSSICVDSEMDESLQFSAIMGKKSVAKEKKLSRVALELQKGKKKMKLLKELKSLREADRMKGLMPPMEGVALVGSSEEAIPNGRCRVNGEQVAENRIEQVPESRVEQVDESKSEQVPKSRIEQVDESRIQQIPESRIEQVDENMIVQVPKSKIEQVDESRREQVPESRNHQVAEGRVEQVPESKIEQVDESRSEQITKSRIDEQVGENRIEQLPKSRIEQVNENRSEQVAESRVEQVPKSKIEQVDESRSEQISQSKIELVAESRSEQVAESRIEQVSESRIEQVAESSSEQVAESTCEKVAESGTEQVAESMLPNSSTQSEETFLMNTDPPLVLLQAVAEAEEQVRREEVEAGDLIVNSLEQPMGGALRSEDLIVKSLEEPKMGAFRSEDLIVKPLEQPKGGALRSEDLIVKSLDQPQVGALRSEDQIVKPLEEPKGGALRSEDLIVKPLEQPKGGAFRSEDLIKTLEEPKVGALRSEDLIVKPLEQPKGEALLSEDLIVNSPEQPKEGALQSGDVMVKSLGQRSEDLVESLDQSKGRALRSGDLIVKSLEQLRLVKGREGIPQDRPIEPRLDPPDKTTLHIDTLKRDHRTFISQQRFSSIYFNPKLPLETYLQSQHDTSQHRCPCDQCRSNNVSLAANHRIILDRYFVNLKGSTGGTVSFDANSNDGCTVGGERGKIGTSKTTDPQPVREVILSEPKHQLQTSEHSREENKLATENMQFYRSIGGNESNQVLSKVSKNTGDVERLLRKSSERGEAACRAEGRYRSSAEKEGMYINQRYSDHHRSSSERLGPCDETKPRGKRTDSHSKQKVEALIISYDSNKRKDSYNAEHVKRCKKIKDEVEGLEDMEERKPYKLSEDEEESYWVAAKEIPDQYRRSPEEGCIKKEETGQYQRSVEEEPDQYRTSPVDRYTKTEETRQYKESDRYRTSPVDGYTKTEVAGQYKEPDQYTTSPVDRYTKTEEAGQYHRGMKEEPDQYRTSPVDKYTKREEAGQYKEPDQSVSRTSPVDRYTKTDEAGQYQEAEWYSKHVSEGERYPSYKRSSPDDEELLKTISEHSSLPLKKRRAFSASLHRDEELAFPSIHTQPMLSIAQLEEERNRLKGVRPPICLPPHMYYPAIYQPLYPSVPPLSMAAVPTQASGAPPQNLVPGAFTTTFIPPALECSGRLRFKTPAQLKGFEDLSAAESLISFSNQQPAFDPPSPPPSPPQRVTRRQTRRRTSTRKRKQT